MQSVASEESDQALPVKWVLRDLDLFKLPT
jgi:hypothetical protein